jgi:hypothetical protein
MQLSLKLHKEEVKERLEEGEEDLVKLSFRVDSFTEKVQRKGEKEFLYRGVMYDIVDAERQGKELLLTVYRDEEETEMREKHQAVRKRQEEEGEKKSEGTGSIHPFKYERVETPFLQHPLNFSTLRNQRPHPSFPGTYLEVPVPPPC